MQEADKIIQSRQAILTNNSKIAFATGKYRLIVADPPWKYELRDSDRTHRGRVPYPTMIDQEIIELPIQQIAHSDSYLLLWTTNAHLPVALRCLNNWGFDYKNTYTWVKADVDSWIMPDFGNTLRIGLGHYGRNVTEFFILATRGNPGSFTSLGLTNIPNAFSERPRKHSHKPEEFWRSVAIPLYTKLEKKYSDFAAIELFARYKRNKWSSWGLEIDGQQEIQNILGESAS